MSEPPKPTKILTKNTADREKANKKSRKEIESSIDEFDDSISIFTEAYFKKKDEIELFIEEIVPKKKNAQMQNNEQMQMPKNTQMQNIAQMPNYSTMNSTQLIVEYDKFNSKKKNYEELFQNLPEKKDLEIFELRKNTILQKMEAILNIKKKEKDNKKKIIFLKQLELYKDDLNEKYDTVVDIVDKYKNLKFVYEPLFNAKFLEYKKNIKNALISFYTSKIKEKYSNNKFKKNFENINTFVKNTEKVGTLKRIKDNIIELESFYKESISTIQKIKPLISNIEFNKYKALIDNKIETLNNTLNNKIKNIKELTSKDIEELKKEVSILIDKIKVLITTYSSKHNYFKNKEIIQKLTEISLLNSFSTTELNAEIKLIIEKLGIVVNKVENLTGTGNINGTEIAPIINLQENIPENDNVFIILNKEIYYKIKKSSTTLTFNIKNEQDELIEITAEIDTNKNIEEYDDNVKIPIINLKKIISPNGQSENININQLKSLSSNIIKENNIKGIEIKPVLISNNQIVNSKTNPELGGTGITSTVVQNKIQTNSLNNTVVQNEIETNSVSDENVPNQKIVKINEEAYEMILRQLHEKYGLRYSTTKTFHNIGSDLSQKIAEINSQKNPVKSSSGGIIKIKTKGFIFYINLKVFYLFFGNFINGNKVVNKNVFMDMSITYSKLNPDYKKTETKSNKITLETIETVLLDGEIIYDKILELKKGNVVFNISNESNPKKVKYNQRFTMGKDNDGDQEKQYIFKSVNDPNYKGNIFLKRKNIQKKLKQN